MENKIMTIFEKACEYCTMDNNTSILTFLDEKGLFDKVCEEKSKIVYDDRNSYINCWLFDVNNVSCPLVLSFSTKTNIFLFHYNHSAPILDVDNENLENLDLSKKILIDLLTSSVEERILYAKDRIAKVTYNYSSCDETDRVYKMQFTTRKIAYFPWLSRKILRNIYMPWL